MFQFSVDEHVKILYRNTLNYGKIGLVLEQYMTDIHPRTREKMSEELPCYKVEIMGDDVFKYLQTDLEHSDEPLTPEFQILVELSHEPKRGLIDC